MEKERLGPTVFVEAEQAASCSADAGGIAAAAVRASAALVELPAFAAVFAVVAAEASQSVAEEQVAPSSGESVLMDCVDAQYAACGLQDPEHPWDLVEPYCVVLSYASNSL